MRRLITLLCLSLFILPFLLLPSTSARRSAHPQTHKPHPHVTQITYAPAVTVPPTTTSTTTSAPPPVELPALLIHPPTTTVPRPPVVAVQASAVERWARVAHCENGGSWTPRGSAYPDGLGITAANWRGNGGGSDLSPAAQVAVAERVIIQIANSRYPHNVVQGVVVYPGFVPDQGPCAPW